MKKMFTVFISSVFALFCFTSCGVSNRSVKRMQQIEEGVSSPTTIDEYKAAVKKYEKRVADIELAQQQIGIWYKILGSRYLDQKMYGEALKCYQKAIEFYPDNQNLYYYVGVCAGYMAHSALDYDAVANPEKKFNYLKLAESAYLRAVTIEPQYVRAMYGLGVLYVFELDESDKAIPYLEKLLTIDKGHTDAKFVLANAYYRSGQMQKAADMYDDIIKTTKDPEKKAAAQENKKQVLDSSYGQ
ncbi:MAG: tetratricopeptide repeat protein [Treponema sp.]